MVLTLGRIRPLCGLIILTLVGSVHFVNGGVDPWWDPSTLWTCISLTLVGSVHFVDWRKLNTGCVRPLCGLVLTLGGIHPLCGLTSLTLVGSVHFVDWC